MGYSFTQIEQDKSRVITAAFCFLVFLYFAAITVIWLLVNNFGYFQSYFVRAPLWAEQTAAEFQWLDGVTTAKVLFWALVFAGVQWGFTAYRLVDRLIHLFNAQDPDPLDETQQMFTNIVEEVSVATGGKQIRPMVIPTMMLNACAFADGTSVPVIAVTKGLLYKLNRSQLEAVVGHEAAHIVSKDGEHTAIISGMFEVFGSSLQGLQAVMQGDWEGGRGDSLGWDYNLGRRWPRSGGGGQGAFLIVFIVVIVLIIWLVNVLAALMRMFISRQREFRADAVAVKLTRNPLALAEALHIISQRRHSLYGPSDALESLLIVSPASPLRGEGHSLWEELFTTHPPTAERINILLNMAFAPPDALDNALRSVQAKEQAELAERQKVVGDAQGGLWYVLTPAQNWSGPHNIGAFSSFEWITADTPVRKMGENTLMNVKDMEPYMNGYRELVNKSPVYACPACAGKLSPIVYEKVRVLECQNCHGLLVAEDMVGVIVGRVDKPFDSRIRAMAQTLVNETRTISPKSLEYLESQRIYRCEQCQHSPQKMCKRLFNNYYPVEVDKCMKCGLVWFDKDELEILQCMFEIRNFDKSLS